MKIDKLDRWLIKALYLIVAGIVLTQIWDLDQITSTLFLLTFPMTVLLWLRSVRKSLTTTDLLMLAAAALAVISVLIDSSISNADITFDYLKKLIMFIMSLLFLQTAHRMRVDADVARFIDKLVDVLSVVFIFMYLTQFAKMHTLNGRITTYLTFRFTNPNLTGLFLMCIYMLQIYRLFTPERWYRKLLHVIMAVFLAVFVVQTRSRNCMLALALFTAVSAWLILRSKWNLRVTKFWAWTVTAFPIVFVEIYVRLVYKKWIQKIFSFIVGEGKKLDARVKVWAPGLEAMRESPIVGAYCDISGNTGMSQLHNSHLDIAASYGILVLILVMILLATYLFQRGKVYTDKNSYIYILSFACAILLGIGEAALFSGGLGIYVFIGAFLLLANREVENSSEL